MEEGVKEQGEVGIGGCEHGGGVVVGGQGNHFACHILADLFWKLEQELLEDIFSSTALHSISSTSICLEGHNLAKQNFVFDTEKHSFMGFCCE